ncbi:exodeoxyribonuclease V subunit alpha [Methylobacter psychrophilus]|uniref:exodeoxyribonuclease V subunit alpha n=1 Tax=Methylobacter psychrophilus TaxID=96941 RepID=UPI0021D4E75F|nr:exodeoxyribonuclease V subunit alpha [Methylobacter psychrophilus]
MTKGLSVLDSIDNWISLGWLTHLDRAFVRFLIDQEPDASDPVLWAGALASHQLGRGEVYLDLEKLCQQPELTLAISGDDDNQIEIDESTADTLGDAQALAELSALKTYTLEQWQTTLSASSLVGLGHGNTPLVLEGNRCYLRRYWQYQQILDQAIQQRLQPIRTKLPTALQAQLQLLFAAKSPESPDWQKIACVLALRARFAIITGGPGTGKTTTLTKLLALLIKLANDESGNTRKLNILLAAPTGKAAARVSESISKALEKLQVPEDIKQVIPKKASTLHRLLGTRHDSRHYVHHRNNPLVADIVIIDEASMIDLEMMASLLDALPENTSLILLGDKDQLASVEAGSVMGDLCRGADNSAYDEPTHAWIRPYSDEALSANALVGSAINQQTVMLRHSHRFGEHSGIGQLAKAVNKGDSKLAQAILKDTTSYQDLGHLLLSHPADIHLKNLLTANTGLQDDSQPKNRQGYGYYLDVIRQKRPTDKMQYPYWAKQVLEAYDTFQVLCALRLGPWGVEGLNQRIEQWLFPGQKPTLWYEGRPVMITRNDYNLGLMNGDVGITLKDSTGKLRVAFPGEDAHDAVNILWISPMRLPDVETAFAITVHKSQGSEFNHVALVLPETKSPVLTRELVYTAITRAKENFTLLESHADIFNQAILATCK